jgi:hypothetical protein
MTIFDVQRLTNHWRRNPPLRVIVRQIAMALGVEFAPQKPDEKKYLDADGFARFVRATDRGRSIIGG